jgi:hypothetical protein
MRSTALVQFPLELVDEVDARFERIDVDEHLARKMSGQPIVQTAGGGLAVIPSIADEQT